MNFPLRGGSRILIASLVVSAAWSVPVAHGQSAEDIQALQDQINALSQQLDELKAQQAASEAKAKEATKVAPKATPTPSTEASGNDIRMHWNEGLRLDSHNGDFKLKFGGRLQNDFGWFSEGDDLKDAGINSQNGTEFRRARMYIGGTIYEDFEFKAQYDFAGGGADFRDVYMAINNVPYAGRIRIGHYKEPFGLENFTSDNNRAFMENSLVNAFAPGYNIGLSFNNTVLNDRLGYSLGVYKETTSKNEIAQQDSDGYNISGRLTGLPIWNKGEEYLHLGVAVSLKELDEKEYAPKIRVASHLSDKTLGLLDTPPVNNASIVADSVDLIGLEAAYARGAFHAQAEYQLAMVNGESGVEDADFSGYYAQVGYFLTGEHKGYKTSSGKIDKIRPNKNFGWGENKGPGAWEVVARYTSLDLEDNGYQGGTLADYTLGLGWYLNPNMRVLLNYTHGELEDGILGDGESDSLDYLQVRFQVTW